MPELEDLIDQETILRNRLEKLIENGKKTAVVKRTVGFYESKSADLRKLWEDYNEVDLQINKILLKSKDTHAYSTENFYSATEAKYSEYIGDLTEGLRSLKGVTTVSVEQSTGTPVHTTVIQHDTVLPRITLPKFSGDYDAWRSFRDLFKSLVHDNVKLKPVQKLHHLKTCLVGDAERFLRHVPITDQDYEPAWTKLEERFENKRILVNHQLKTLTNQAKLNVETLQGMRSLIDTTEECLQQLKCLKVDTDSWDALLIYLMVQKLPFQTLKLWEEDQGSNQELPTFKQFRTFLDIRLTVLESIADKMSSKSSQSKPPTREKAFTCNTIKARNCPACNGKHFIQKCQKYNGMNVQARRRIMQAAGRCLNCLSNNHTTSDCTSKFKCFKCNQLHHTSLHDDNSYDKERATIPKNKVNTPNSNSSQIKAHRPDSSHNDLQTANSAGGLGITQSFITNENIQAMLATALVRAQVTHGKSHVLRCLIDLGPQSSFITEAACQKLHAKYTPTSTAITGLSTNRVAVSNKQTTLQLRSCGSNEDQLTEDFLVLKKITDPLPTRSINIKDHKHLSGLHFADSTCWKPGKIDALLGAGVYSKIVLEGIRRGSDTTPVAINTIFGWIILGPTTQAPYKNTASFSVTTNAHLSAQLSKFWEIEEIAQKPILTKEEEECETIFKETHKRLDTGKYQVKLPFINDQVPDLGQSRPQALKRFNSLQRQFYNKPQFKEEYSTCLNEYIILNHMEEVDPPKDDESHYYIPHHAVFKESSTTRLRVVFDASCKTSNGRSLNDCLLKGPTLQPKLFATLLNWRKYQIAINADLEKMYRMVEIHPNQRTYQRIIWQNPTTEKIQDYQLKTVTFGTSSAPYLAIRTILQLAEDEKEHWPLAAKVIHTSFYVDDLLSGADNVSDTKTLQAQLIELLKAGGFNLRKWASNSPEVLKHIPIEHRELKDTLTLAEDASIKTLGIQWHPTIDCFTFKITPRENQGITTKRTILSEVASLYDPLGWLAPVIVVAKLMMQTLWITGCSWDAQVIDTIERQWITYKNELQQLTLIKIPRWVRYSTKTNAQIHGFCDASAKAYAAVLYIRVEHPDGTISCDLLTSKTRVAPIKPTTIPRLELNGAVILARLIKTTIEDMQFNHIPIYAWTDSMIVLQWIKEHPARWKTYIANRVVEIQDVLKYDNWQHISTKYNPADLASRGITATSLIDNELWWHGPSWLTKGQTEWPQGSKISESTDLEAKQKSALSLTIQPEENLLLKYSSWTRLIRILAWIKRFTYNCQNKSLRRRDFISSTEWSEAETTIIRVVQQTAFSEEFKLLSQEKPLSNQSKLIRLNPFLDKDNVIRVGGRLTHSRLPFCQKHPIILPRDHHVTTLLIDRIHRETLHGGTSLTLASSRSKYWILDARRAITSRIHKCIVCARFRKEANTQLMGNLPSSRVNIAKPFLKVGVDFAGPVSVKASLCRNAKILKAYICIFVCMATRAVHIELVSSLTSEAFIAALKRFVSRRGLCSDIYSDCGTNFVGGTAILNKDLRKAIKEASVEAAQYFASKAIKWHFNPPASPHFGGIWEAGVKSIKHHLRRTLGNSNCTFEEYTTILNQIECCLNSRPLCYISNNPEEPFILTPGHFLIGQALNAVPEPDYADSNVLPSRRWEYLQERLRHFWNKWLKEYLNQLQTRNKWQSTQKNLQTGDVVLIKNENVAPTNWPLGVIENVYPGTDGLVRVVQVRTQNNIIQRPVRKICRLPIEKQATSEDAEKS